MRALIPGGLLAVLVCTACAPLQQAPLVYSSKNTFGLDVSGTSTETPGFSFNVGFKQVDAAYVPVAVAKPCEASGVSDGCANAAFHLTPIVGTSSDEEGHDAGPAAQRAKEIIKRYGDAEKAAEAARAAAEITTRQIVTAEERVATLKSQNDRATAQQAEAARLQAKRDELVARRGSAPLSADDTGLLSTIEAQLAAATAAPLTASEAAELKDKDQSIQQMKKALAATKTQASEASSKADQLRLEAELAKLALARINRKDAYSVYGRFEGSAGGSASAASVGLGKVFSTGVASQSLAAGLQKYYEGLSAVVCLEAVAKLGLTDDSSKLEQLAACRTRK